MPLTDAEGRFLDAVSLHTRWALGESFATIPRWRPEDVDRAVAYCTKPRCSSFDVLEGRTAPLVRVQANSKALRSY